jgi:hypothetical protein
LDGKYQRLVTKYDTLKNDYVALAEKVNTPITLDEDSVHT